MKENGIGFCGLLTLILIVLKILKLITISWFWVLAPIWIPTLVTLLVIALVFLIEIISQMK